MKIGYARVSTAGKIKKNGEVERDRQTLDLQLDALNAAGVEKIFSDKGISGSVREREGLNECLASLQKDDCLIVYKLDRLARSLSHAIEVIDNLASRQVNFKSITEGFDTTTPSGRMIFQIIGALAEFERSLIRERVIAGVRAAQARGVHCGQTKRLTLEEAALLKLLFEDGAPVPQLMKQFHISKPTVYRYLKS